MALSQRSLSGAPELPKNGVKIARDGSIVVVKDYSSAVNEIKGVLKEHLSKVRDISGEWDTLLNNKTLEINNLKDTVRGLRAKGNGFEQSQVLQEGIDVYIGKRTRDIQQSLAVAIRERDEAQKQLAAQKKANLTSQALVKKYKTKSEELTAIIDKMRGCEKYDGSPQLVENLFISNDDSKPIKALDDEYKHFEDQIKERLQTSFEQLGELKPPKGKGDRSGDVFDLSNYQQSDVMIFAAIVLFLLVTIFQ